MNSSSGHLEINFSWLPWPKKTPWCQKLLLIIPKRTKFIKFFRLFFIGPWGHVEGSFVKLAERLSSSYRKLFAQVIKNDIFFSFKKRFSSNLSTWHLQCSLKKRLKSFPIKILNRFGSKSEFHLEKSTSHDFFSGHVKNHFGNLSRRNCQKPKYFLSQSGNMNKIRRFQRSLCPKIWFSGETSGTFNNPDKWFLPEGRKMLKLAKS